MSAARVLLALASLLAAPAVADGDCGGFAFEDVAAAAGVDFRHHNGDTGERHLPATMGSGAAWIDFDGDGWLDLYLVEGGRFPPAAGGAGANRLYRNRGDGTFEDFTGRSGAGDRGYGQGALACDLDGDGGTDLVLTNFESTVVLRNRGDGSFAAAPAALGATPSGGGSSAACADADGDGDLDLYVARYVRYDPDAPLFCGDPAAGRRDFCHALMFDGESDLYFRNRGDGSFEAATAAAGFTSVDGRGLGVVFVDLDGDRAPEVYVANDLHLNRLYWNRGDGRFEDVSLISGTAVGAPGVPEAGMGLAVADVDGDGLPDLLVTNFDVELNSLFRNLGDAQFEDRTTGSGFGLPSYNLLGFGIVAGDFDRDGAIDAYVVNGHVLLAPRADTATHAQRELLLAGDGHGRFAERRCSFAAEASGVGRGLAGADYDNDGALDLAVQRNDGAARLLRNRAPAGSWLGLHLRGGRGNPEAVGAQVDLVAEDARQRRWVIDGDSYLSTSDRRVLFGFDAARRPSAVEITWRDGRRMRLESPPPGSYLLVPRSDR